MFRTRNIKRIIALLRNAFGFVILMLFFISNSWSQESSLFSQDASDVKIRSEIIDIKRKLQRIEFKKNVIVESGDSSLLADRMYVLYLEGSSKGQGSVQKIIANDNVKIFAQDFTATGKKGHYDPKQDVFVLEEDVIVNNGLSIASGEYFLYDLKNEKGIFIGQKNVEQINDNKDNRVKVIINSDE